VRWLAGEPAKLERDTGWQAEIPFERTLDEVLEAWRGRVAEAGS
jgi:nucleoside-diphosphate-sugar epimerase